MATKSIGTVSDFSKKKHTKKLGHFSNIKYLLTPKSVYKMIQNSVLDKTMSD